MFGDFSGICARTSLPLCTLVSPLHDFNTSFPGILPDCYARTVDVSNTLIFQIGTAFIHISSLIVTLMIIYNVRLRYTSVGRKEMLVFYWSFILFTISSIIVDTGVAPAGSTTYGYFVSFQVAMTGVCCWTLFFAGLSSLNFWDDGSVHTMAALFVTSFAVFTLNYVVSLLTFENWTNLINRAETTSLFVLYFIVNGTLLFMYLVCQLFICFVTLVLNWWAIGALCFSVFFFVAAECLLYIFNYSICTSLNHYVDGLIFSTLSNLFAIMLVYKYWDIITFDDDEYIRYTEIVQGVGYKEETQALLS
ncbi:hypothetical protein OGAPHI_001954 [Ogataea philodendri]|uniref:Chitin synthase export chaperone n=1 Tax=Ogataea philodendri TaxID=1378263 RepID=A0A9P8PAW0_9ASCO|nr:uncharacterized protein OGAPHI_001954 [Ogataea philodendri]KAH3668200.1 hypothetical protein OGAPHI_001954 [Ogataea philodendri]